MNCMDETKAKLIAAAGEEFALKGFAGATIRSISVRAGVNIAAVNYHFGDKARLYEQVLLAAQHQGEPLVSDDEFFVGTPAEQLRRFIESFLRNLVQVGCEESWPRTLMMREMIQPTAALDVVVREEIRPRFDRLLAILRTVCPEADHRRLHMLGFSVVSQCVFYKTCKVIAARLIGEAECRSLTIEEIAEHIASTCVAALGLAAPLDAAGRGPNAITTRTGKAAGTCRSDGGSPEQ